MRTNPYAFCACLTSLVLMLGAAYLIICKHGSS